MLPQYQVSWNSWLFQQFCHKYRETRVACDKLVVTFQSRAQLIDNIAQYQTETSSKTQVHISDITV